MTYNYQYITDKLADTRDADDGELKMLIDMPEEGYPSDYDLYLSAKADSVRRLIYQDKVYIRGLIEFTNYCKNNCYYCGIRCGNAKVERYRLSADDILFCCDEGYRLGFRTFVLQGGEDPFYDEALFCDIITAIRQSYPDCAITLSIGEWSKESYQAFFDAGANRFLLRHETAKENHYRKLHPEAMNPADRKTCLFNLKNIGYQVGSGFMVGSPFQTTDHLVEDIRFLQNLQPDMIGIGPYLSHRDTPFSIYPDGSMIKTLRLISILRLMFPYALIPSTTALSTISPAGRELGLKAGANVVMPNLSPKTTRSLYNLYDNKAYSGTEAAESIAILTAQTEQAGYKIVTERGDVKKPH